MTKLTPSMLELMDRTTIRAVEGWRPMGLDESAEALLIAQSDAPGEAGIAEADLLLEICERSGATEVYRSEDPEQAEMLLGARRMAIPALESLGDWLLDDIAVPRSQLARAMTMIAELAVKHDVMIATFGHAGDGNLHPTIVIPRGDEAAASRAMEAFNAILDVALACGGTITRLCLIGRFTDGSEAGFWAKARALGLADRIEAKGWLAHDAALAVAARCDIALILFQPGAENHRLALPHKLFDAMLAGLPVIAPMAATEVKAVVESAGCGVLVDVADPTAIAAAIQHLAQPARRAALGAAGQRAALARFAWAGEAARLVALYRRLLARDAAHLLRAR